jgi:hypothetical protein
MKKGGDRCPNLPRHVMPGRVPRDRGIAPGRVYPRPMLGIGLPELLVVLAAVALWFWAKRP